MHGFLFQSTSALHLEMFCNLFPEGSYLKIGMIGHMVSPHGKLTKIVFLDFLSLWCCVWSGGWLCVERFCNLFPGVFSLKIGHVNEHGQPPWTKIV